MSDKTLKGFAELEEFLSRQSSKKQTLSPQTVAGRVPAKKVSSKTDEEDAQYFLQTMQGVEINGKNNTGFGQTGEGLLADKLAALGFEQPENAETSKKQKKNKAVHSCKAKPTGLPLEKKLTVNPQAGAQGNDVLEITDAASGTSSLTGSEEKVSPLSAEEALFLKAVHGAKPMQAKGRDIPKATQIKKKSPAAVSDALADFLLGKIEFDVCNADEYVEGFVIGLDPLVLGKLRGGGYSPEAHLDLHGQNSIQALDSLMLFIKNAYQRNMRTVLIITGRGNNSPNGQGVIRADLQEWLTHEPFRRVVLGFCTAKPCDGGAGAIYVLLRKFKKSSGKIRWERFPSTEDFL